MFGAMAVFMILIVLAVVFWLWMLVDCLTRKDRNFPNKGGNERLIWVLVLLFLNVIGAILYYFLVKAKK
ncbi:MAG: PLDc N-terminal domain-containing protein [Candidatus Aenigmarchaeota archaeon]|nr:PLDc N-terminal domain-containing protein [Candidatus Aenigmarchaeota archaeon]